ncbi:hypothetical protein HID58_062802 [Brassica napus]|uniref:S-protein homolog n=1 Tax=Brassica napus TaxID=3708 RepID=A0ABQ8A2J2_BRANA|nr:hypothetical protein HID58_062802 [Brassica napus]
MNLAYEARCHKNTVAFQNNLTLSRTISKNDDLGDHFLSFHDGAYSFSFHDHFIQISRSKCVLWKGANLEYHKNFTGFEADKYKRYGPLICYTHGKHEMMLFTYQRMMSR